ncbi:MAG: Gfo/Idh/MocA family oxidoreductase [Candidatus Omnitrophota bacterium]
MRSAAGGVSALSAAMLGPASGKTVGANERINIAVIGTGGMGTSHIRELMKRKEEVNDVQIVAVCDVYQRRLNHAAELSGGKPYRYYKEMFNQEDLDAIYIATPDHWHAAITIDGINRGLDVYVQKPMTHTVEEAKAVWKTAVKTGRIVQVGSQLTSEDQWWRAREAIDAGMIGELVWAQSSYARNTGDKGDWNGGINPLAGPNGVGENNIDWNEWLGPAPKRPWDPDRCFRFRKYWDYSGGLATDLFYHRLAPLNIALTPRFPWRAAGMGGIWVHHDSREVPDTFLMTIDYAAEYSIHISSSGANDVGLDDCIRGHKGTIYMRGDHIEVEGNGPYREEFKKKYGAEKVNIACQPRDGHTENFLKCMKTREQPHLDPYTGFKVQAALTMSTDSYRQSKILYFDEKKLKVTARPISLPSQKPGPNPV